MQVSKVSFNQYNQNFGRIYNSVLKTKLGDKITSVFSTSKGKVGEIITQANGNVSGWRIFKGGERLKYATYSEKDVILSYHFPEENGKMSRRFFVFDLGKFKENIRELTSLKGIQRCLDKIEKAPKKTVYEPCC